MKKTTVRVSRDDDSGMTMYEVMDKLEEIGVKSEILSQHEDGMEIEFSVEKRCQCVEKIKPKPKGFLICPVRGADTSDSDEIVKQLESGEFDGQKWDIHYPPRDTDQEDDTGFRICEDNRKAIDDAERVFFVWDGKSQGSLFDLGMAFVLDMPLTCISLPVQTEGKSFQKMAMQWSDLDENYAIKLEEFMKERK